MSGRRRLTRVLAVLIGAFAVWLSAAGTADAAPVERTPAKEAPTCRVGAYLSDLYDLDPAKNAFSARLTVWSVCPKRELDPLPDVAFTNSSDAEKSEPSVTQEAGMFRDLVRIQGVFRQDWDLRAFPYDRHRITINITSRTTIDKFRFTPDNEDSGANEGLAPDGWKLTGFHLTAVEQHFPTNFGDTTLPRGKGSTRSRLVVEMDLARDDPTAFWRLTGPLYLMVLLATAAFLLPTHGDELGMAERLDSMQSRLALLGGGLFVVMLNLQQVSTVVTSTVGLTLIDGLHLLTLVYVLLAVLATVLSWRWTVRGGCPARAERVHHRYAWIGLAAYALVAAALVVYAAGLV
ncbi:hypothetical protein [Streptomyces hesseae]|uniref:Uncharacterized protein n=1 Tax=Streptomyces hesseae TaxID=3075519 RepID=A0ABU2SJ95_9ACTN|nr:hypothetical protein [Streptomyces sp. DSM 40473]MDT0449057.1 hypothetical protein [Streptomyces sp. DSM 40473]